MRILCCLISVYSQNNTALDSEIATKKFQHLHFAFTKQEFLIVEIQDPGFFTVINGCLRRTRSKQDLVQQQAMKFHQTQKYL